MEKVFDAHIHYKFEIPLPKTVEIFKKEFQETATQKGCFLSLPYLDGKGQIDYFPTQNIKGLYLKHAFSPDFYAFSGLVYPKNLSGQALADELLRQAEEYALAGYDGMKMLEAYPSLLKHRKLPIDSEVYDKYYAFMQENGLPIVVHLANPDTCWDYEKAGESFIKLGRVYDHTYPTKNEITAQLFAVMKKFPKLKVILAHFGFFSLEKENAERFLGDYENTAFDITPGGEQLINMSRDWASWLPFIEKYQDRILYGTDFYAFPDDNEEEWRTNFKRRPDFVRQFMETNQTHLYVNEEFTGVLLEKALRKKIYFDNAERLFGSPKPVRMQYLFDESDRLLNTCPDLKDLDKADLRYILEKIHR